MPKDFDDCVNSKGSIVRTKKLSGGRFIHLCKRKNGSWTAGEVKRKQATHTKTGKKRKKKSW